MLESPTRWSRPSGPRAISLGLQAAIALALLGACGDGPAAAGARPSPGRSGAVEPISVSVVPVELADMTASYGTSATLRAQVQATVTSRTRGVIEQLFVEEGDPVEATQVMAKLEDKEQQLALTRAESIHAIKVREFNRLTELNEQRVISDNEYELIRREVEEARLDQELAQLNFERTSIRSPFDGVVVLRRLDVGATVSDGTEIFDVADVDPLYVDVSVPERHVGRLAPGQSVRLNADEIDEPVEARIERLAPVVDAGTGTVKVTVAVEGAVKLRPGAFVEVQIVTDLRRDVLVVPRSALVAEGRRWQVFRPVPGETGSAQAGPTETGAGHAAGSVEAIEVQLGFEEGDRVQILAVGERGIAAGDLVVSVGASALSDGAPVRILGQRGAKAQREPEGTDTESASVEATAGSRE